MTVVFVPKEVTQDETRVSATPATVKSLVKYGFEVLVEASAGEGSCIRDGEFEEAGAKLVRSASEGFSRADLIVMLNPPTVEQVREFKEGASLISFLYPYRNPEVVEALKLKKANALAMELIPRITRAQKCDALSSQANLAGYQAMLLAAAECPKLFPLMMTAAGTLRPSRVVVMGAGVAGLQAVATAKRLGALVEVSDIRPAVKEQVESLGAVFIDVPTDESMETDGGYAREATKEFLEKQAAITRTHVVRADAVVTSALVPGKKAPVLIPEDMVKEMKPGSVIVDMAAEQGGNCALTVPGETVVVDGVKIVGALNLAGQVPMHASEAYAKNILFLIEDQLNKEKQFAWGLDDEVVQGALVTLNGETDWVAKQAPAQEAAGEQAAANS